MKYILYFFFLTTSLFSDQFVIDKVGDTVRLIAVKTADEIILDKGKDILVRSFMKAYEDVPLAELNPSFKSIGDARRFYVNYFESELGHYKNCELIWVQAFIGEELVGWATFELEDNDSVYMNLLIVDPSYQSRGIGKHLVFSICAEDLYPNTQAINALLRKVNEQGRLFYEKIGFSYCPEYQREDNYVDISLLIPIRWDSSR
jgi:ribosomal protein S18 acetylase RimI-like enzyme